MADFERRTKSILDTYTMLDTDSGTTLICNKATQFSITLQSPTGRHFFDVMVVNIGAGLVTIGALTVGQYSHAHITNLAGTTWVVAIGGGAETDPVFTTSVAYGIIAQDLIDWTLAHTKVAVIPEGGAEDYVLAKNSAADYDGKWVPAIGAKGDKGDQGLLGPEQPRPTDIQYYADGFIVVFADTSVRNYSWVKDGDGQITNITNTTPDPDEVLAVGYHSGNRP